MNIGTILGVVQILAAAVVGLGGLHVINIPPDILTWIIGLTAGTGGVHKVLPNNVK